MGVHPLPKHAARTGKQASRAVAVALVPFLLLAILGYGTTPGPTPQVRPVAITAPAPNSSVQGTVTVEGRTAVPGFRLAVLEYQALPRPGQRITPVGWLPIAVMTQSTAQGWLADWDTSTLPPGPYALRLRVETERGTLYHQITVWVGMPAPTPPAQAPASPRPRTPVPLWSWPTPRPWPTPLPQQAPLPPRMSYQTAWTQRLLTGAAVGLTLVVLYLVALSRRW